MRTSGQSEHALCLRRMILDRSLNIGGTLVLAGRWFTKRDCRSHIEIMIREAQPFGEGCAKSEIPAFDDLRPGRHGRQRACRGYIIFLDRPGAGRSNCRSEAARPGCSTGGGIRPTLKKCPRVARKAVKYCCSAKLAKGNKAARLPSLPPPEVAGFSGERRRQIV